MDLAEFLEARYAEREAAAKAAAVDPVGAMEAHFETEALHHEQDWRLYPERETDYDHGQADALHWASTRIRERMLPLSLHDPASVLADIAAKRAILDMWQDPAAVRDLSLHPGADPEHPPQDGRDPDEREVQVAAAEAIDDVVRLLAAPFAAHPDYQAGWAL
jgi:hypothetical protein